MEYFKFKKNKKQKMITTWNQLDLKTLGHQPIMLRNVPGHWLLWTCIDLVQREATIRGEMETPVLWFFDVLPFITLPVLL